MIFSSRGAIIDIELKKRVPFRVAVFLFITGKMIVMSQKIPRKKKFHRETSTARGGNLWSLQLSSEAFYGTFLSITFVISGLLFGASLDIANTHIPIPTKSAKQVMFESKVNRLVAGYPIEQMAPIINEQNTTTAAFLVSIAKKESNWGKRVPRAEDGTDCYNYWGYRGAGSRGIAMGHGCFGSAEEAVGVVGGRIDTLVNEYHFRTAKEMIVWKCGWSCDGHSNKSVSKWIADVGYYYAKIK